MLVTKTSSLSGKTHTRKIDITPDQYKRYCEGDVLIQKVFPNLSADDREFLMSGITPEEWIRAFGEGE